MLGEGAGAGAPPMQSVLLNNNGNQQGGGNGGGLEFVNSGFGGQGGQGVPNFVTPKQQGVMGGSMTGMGGSTSFDDEPPLLEELGINFEHIIQKTMTVLHPGIKPERNLMDDTDIAGPLFFAVVMGFSLLLTGKLHFGYVYGIGMIGCFLLNILLSCMCDEQHNLTFIATVSVLGYSFLPMVLLSVFNLILKVVGFSLSGVFGFVLSIMSILWCTHAASDMVVTTMEMRDQRFLVAYPVGIFYACFALMTVF